jgi:hypothetical protein
LALVNAFCTGFSHKKSLAKANKNTQIAKNTEYAITNKNKNKNKNKNEKNKNKNNHKKWINKT